MRKPKKEKQWAEWFSSGQSDENPPYFVGIAAVSFAPYATFLFSWDYAIIIADKSCLLPWHQINARGALKLAFPLQESSLHASCSGFNPLCKRSHSFCNFQFLFSFLFLFSFSFYSHADFWRHLQSFDTNVWKSYARLRRAHKLGSCVFARIPARIFVWLVQARL